MTVAPSLVVEALARLSESELIDMKMRLKRDLTYVSIQVQQLEEALERKASSTDTKAEK